MPLMTKLHIHHIQLVFIPFFFLRCSNPETTPHIRRYLGLFYVRKSSFINTHVEPFVKKKYLKGFTKVLYLRFRRCQSYIRR